MEMAECDRYLINGVSMRFKFVAHNSQFCCMGSTATTGANALAATQPILKVIDASLFVRHVQLSPGVFNAINKSLQISNAVYPIKRRQAVLFNLAAGQSHFPIDNIFLGTLPDQMIIVLVDHGSNNGDYLKNPLAFKNYGLNYLSVTYNNKNYPAIPLTPDYASDNFEREYFTFHNELGLTSGIGVLDITYPAYKSYANIYCFNFNQDFSNTTTDYICLAREGGIRIDIKFAQDLAQALKVICIGRFDNNIGIDKNRNVSVDY